jgi:hypothetical protein
MEHLLELETWAKVGEAVAILIFLYSIYEHTRREREKEIMQWQKAALFKIITDRGPILKDDIKGYYFDEATQFDKRLRKKDLSETTITTLLLELIAQRAIRLEEPDDLANSRAKAMYAVATFVQLQPPPPLPLPPFGASYEDALKARAKETIAHREVLAQIASNNGKFNEAELREHLEQINRLDLAERGRLSVILMSLQAYRMAMPDETGKLWRIVAQPPPTRPQMQQGPQIVRPGAAPPAPPRERNA